MRFTRLRIHSRALDLGMLISVLLVGCDETAPPAPSANGDLVIDGVRREFGNETLDVQGNVIVENGGELILNGTTLNIISSFDEEFIIEITGNSRLETNGAVIQGQAFQTAIIAEPKNGASPTLVFTNTTVTFHAGIRPFGNTVTTATDSDIEEIQVHDQAVVSVTGGEGLYPVFFFNGLDAELNDLTDGMVTRSVDVPGGWSFEMRNVDVDGYQIDVEGDSTVTLTNCQAITASIHTPGTLGSDEVVVRNVTTNGPADGVIADLGAEIVYINTAIDLFNVYVASGDVVRIDGGVVNEANTSGSSQLTIADCTVAYNLVQAYDESTLIIENCSITSDTSTQPSLTAESDSRVTVRNSDCARLEAQAIGNGRIDFVQPRNLDTGLLTVQDNGEIHVNAQPVQ